MSPRDRRPRNAWFRDAGTSIGRSLRHACDRPAVGTSSDVRTDLSAHKSVVRPRAPVAHAEGPPDGLTADSMLEKATGQSVRKPTLYEHSLGWFGALPLANLRTGPPKSDLRVRAAGDDHRRREWVLLDLSMLGRLSRRKKLRPGDRRPESPPSACRTIDGWRALAESVEHSDDADADECGDDPRDLQR